MLGGLLIQGALWSQMPPQPATLVVRSTPSGARITINDKVMDRPTDATFRVVPGHYRVSVSGSANCPEEPVDLTSGQTRTLVCNGTSWTVQ